jgi:hypothetical protein
MTVLAADNYTRSNQTGWGTSTGPNSGQAWSIIAGSGWTLTSNSGRVNSTASNAFLLGTGTQGDTEGFCQSIIIDMTNGDWFGLILRGDSLGQNQYYCTIKPELGTSNLILIRTNSNVDTSLATATITFTTNHVYAVRFRVTGNVNPRCQVRCWDTSGSEPSTWNIDFTDSNASHITGAGRYGLFGSDGTSGDIKFTSASFNDTLTATHLRISDGLGGVFS